MKKDLKEKQKRAPIVEALQKYKDNPCTGFHIPGHNRGLGVYPDFKNLIGEDVLKIDTTDEFDNLGTLHPQSGPIKEAQELAREAFGAKRSFFITGGSTIGNLAIAFGATRPNEEVIVGRNCHRSIITGLIMSGANPNWLIPQKLEDWAIFGPVEPSNLRETLKNSRGAGLVWITNPTYEGVISDIEEIAKICKKFDVPLVVDEAHGSLWNFNKKLPNSALKYGADMVIHSLHKTGGSMTQSSILHLSEKSRFDEFQIEEALKFLHTTSPSLLLLGSLDASRAYLMSDMGQNALDNAIENAYYLRRELSKIKNVSVLSETPKIHVDPTKIFIKVKGLRGVELEKILEDDYRIEIESASDEGLLVLSNIGGKREEFDYLIKAIKEISNKEYVKNSKADDIKYTPLVDPKILMSPRDAYFSPKKRVPKREAIGRICTEIIAFCPPGISILLPGELVREEHMPYLSDREEIEVLKLR